MVSLSYMLPRAAQLQGFRRWGALVVGASAVYLGIISTSATFVVASVVLAIIAAVTFTIGFLSRRTAVSAIVGVVACVMVVAALWLIPVIAEFVQSTVDQKVSSSSFDERGFANDLAYKAFLDTYGFGVGLGSSRASSFLPGLLSTTGLLGALLFAAAVVILITRSAPVREYRPVIWALVAVLVLKVVAGPDLSDSSGILWMSLGLLSRAAVLARTCKESTPSDDDQFLARAVDDR
jgi:hypothetical protein